jgi:hypothetical protein
MPLQLPLPNLTTASTLLPLTSCCPVTFLPLTTCCPQVYQALEAEQLIDLERRVYCPYKDCSTLLERPDQQDGQAAAAADEQEAPFECPVCHRSFCLTCGIAGWHTVRTSDCVTRLAYQLSSHSCSCTVADRAMALGPKTVFKNTLHWQPINTVTDCGMTLH